MTTLTLSQDQLDAVCDAQDEDAELAELAEVEVAKRLAASGHPLFAGFGQEAPATKPARASRAAARPSREASPRSSATAPAPAAAPQAAAVIPELDTGAPGVPPLPAARRAELEQAAREDHEADQRQERAQLPAKVGQRPAPLARRQGAGVGVEGMEHLDQGDMVIPSLQLKQPQTRDDHQLGIAEVPDGEWFLTNDPMEAVERAKEPDVAPRVVAFLEIRRGRQFLLPYNDDERAKALGELGLLDLVSDDVNVVCSSPDRILPVLREGQEWPPFAESCAQCPHSRWTTGESGRRRPPACGETYRGIAVDLTDGNETPARIFLRSTAIRPTKSLLTNLAIAAKRETRIRARAAKEAGEKVAPWPMCGFEVELGSKKVVKPKATYYVPTFSRPQAIEDEDLVEGLRALRESLLDEVENHVEDAAPAPSDEEA